MAVEADELQIFFEDLLQLVNDVENRENQDISILQERLNLAVSSLSALTEGLPRSRTKIQLVISNLQIMTEQLNRELLQVDQRIAIYRTESINENSRGPGRPKKLINEETLIYFRNLGFSWNEICC